MSINTNSSKVVLPSVVAATNEDSKKATTTTSTIGLSKRIKRIPNSSDSKASNDSNNNNQVTSATAVAATVTATKAPKDTLRAVYAAGKYKAGLKLDVLCVQSTMAGIFIAFAGQLYLSVGGGLIGAVLFPGGLIAVILTSAELFTGDALIFVASVLGGQVPIHRLVRNWCVSWICNFMGSVLWAYFLGYLSHALEDVGATELAIQVAEKKALDHMGSIFLKGIGANFLVCIAVWQGTTAEEASGKVLTLWWPTASFILLGFSHCVANMYLIPMGMMLGANISVGRMFTSILMATLGNVVGGGFFVGAVYWYVFDSLASTTLFRSRIQRNMVRRNSMVYSGQSVINNESDNTNRNNNTIDNNNNQHRHGDDQQNYPMHVQEESIDV